jgi:hypothetical protein
MRFDDAAACEQICYQLRIADYPRGQNRTRIDRLLDGWPPFSDDMAEQNGVKINVNFLEGTVLAHDARAQFYGAFLKPGLFFTGTTDLGAKHKQGIYSNTVTTQINKIMKRSMVYFETFRSKFALDVAHGIGPATWCNSDVWCPDAARIADIGIPARTQLTMKNLPFFYVYRSFTLPELIKMTSGPKVDKGWNKPLVKKCIKWMDNEMMALMGSNWPEVWSPEKTEQRIKGDGGFYAGDEVPTIDAFDFYFWNDDKDVQGWNRRIILDSWSTPQASGGVVSMSQKQGFEFGRNQFLYNSEDRKYASKLSELISFQFADLSAVAPFEYHSVRSLGWLVYAVCNLQNRMRCKFSEAVFEALMNYYRVNSSDEVDRALKLDLINHGFIDPSIQFVPREQRWNVDKELVELGMKMNQDIIGANSSGYTQQPSQGGTGDRKTRFQVMAEIQQMTALVNSAFNQSYQYQEAEYREIMRRFFKKDSRDPDVNEFRKNCMLRGVPESILVPEAWEIEPTRVMGNGNQTLQMQIAQQLLEMRNLFDPEPQREILRDATFIITGDADKAERWCPDQPVRISDSVHDAQVSFGTLMQGYPVSPKTGQNHKEYVGVYLSALASVILPIEKQRGMATMPQIKGFQTVAQAIEQHIKIIGQDKNEKQFVAEAEKQLAKLMNFVKAFVQRLQQAMQKQQQQNGAGGQIPPETMGKIAATKITAQAKAQNQRESHAQRTAERQITFERKEQQEREKFASEQQRENLRTDHEIQMDRLKSASDDGSESST